MEGSLLTVPPLLEEVEAAGGSSHSSHSICQLCGHAAPDVKSLLVHLRLHLEGSEDLLASCELTSPPTSPLGSPGPLEDHLAHQEGRGGGWRCEICSRAFNSKASLDYHLKMHNDPAKHYCPLCQHFINSSKVATHNLVKCAQSARMEKKYECEDCGKRFKGLASLHLHKAIHSEKKFTCKFCFKSFTQKVKSQTKPEELHSMYGVSQKKGFVLRAHFRGKMASNKKVLVHYQIFNRFLIPFYNLQIGL